MAQETTIVLTEIKCISTSETGHDEVYVQYTIDDERTNRFPEEGYYAMSTDPEDNVWPLNLPLTFKESVVVSLYDNDGVGDDFLGSCTYMVNTPTQPATETISNTNGAEYELATILSS